MRRVAGIVVGVVVAWLVLGVLAAVSGNGVGPLELLVLGGPAFAFGYWLTVRRHGPDRERER